MNSTTTLFGHSPQMNSTFLLYVLKLQNCYLTKAEKKTTKKTKKKHFQIFVKPVLSLKIWVYNGIPFFIRKIEEGQGKEGIVLKLSAKG